MMTMVKRDGSMQKRRSMDKIIKSSKSLGKGKASSSKRSSSTSNGHPFAPSPSPTKKNPSTRSPTAPSPVVGDGVELEWFGPHAYMKASRVQATIDDGTRIAFRDDLGRPEVIESGGGGEEISRERDWTEGGVERRVKFYFASKGVNGTVADDNWFETSGDYGWYLYDARMYNSQGSDWVYFGGDFRNATMVQTPPGKPLFYCDYFELNYSIGWSTNKPGGKFVAENFTIGGYLPEGYQIDSLEVFNPCEERYPGEICRATDGVVQCGDAILSLNDLL
jgi:hypothetical protein